MGRPRRVNEVGGGLVLAAGLWTEEDRKRCRDFARLAEGDNRRPPQGTHGDVGPRPPDLEERIARHHAAAKAARAVSRGRGKGKGSRAEPIHCWGGCGRSLGHGRDPRAYGWHSRRVRLDAGPQIEVLCGECYARDGWLEPDEGGVMPKIGKGRAAVLEGSDTAHYARLTDDHLVVDCHDCERPLLADKHAAEVLADPVGLPPLAAGTVKLPGGRTLRYCAVCIGTHVIKHDRHTAGGGDRRADKPLLDADGAGPWADNAVRDGEDAAEDAG